MFIMFSGKNLIMNYPTWLNNLLYFFAGIGFGYLFFNYIVT